MSLGEIARCYLCKIYASGEELELNRKNWEYQCKDIDACFNRRRSPDIDRDWSKHTSGFPTVYKRRK